MDYRNNKSKDAWDDGVYGTGNTMPPKSHSGIIALLLILVIFLSGIVSFLSFMNIKLFKQLTEQNAQRDELAPMSFSDLQIHPSVPDTEPERMETLHPIQGDVSISLNKSPQSVENVPQEGALSWQEIYETNIPGVVSVASYTDTGNYSGCGIVVSEKGYIVTVYHLVSGAETITVRLADGRECSAVVVGADQLTDLAVLYVDGQNLQPVLFGDSDALRVGDTVAAIGDPLGAQLGGAMTTGMISAINRDIPYMGQNISLIQSSIALIQGSAGGPLINCYGQIIGINTTVNMEENAGSIGFAIPSTTVKQIVDQLIAQGYVSGRPTLGISGNAITRFDQYYFQIPQGLYIDWVDGHSDTFLKGIEPGDILISLDGVSVTGQSQLDTIVNSHAIGDTVKAVIYREGKEETITLTVTEYVG